MARPRSGLAGIFFAAALLAGVSSSAEAALFVTVENDVAADAARGVGQLADKPETGGASAAPGNPAQQLIAENIAPVQPSRAGWVPLIGALMLVAYRMRRPNGRKRIESAV